MGALAPRDGASRVGDVVGDLAQRELARRPSSMVGGVLWTEAELFEKLESKYGERVDLDPHDHEL